MQLVICDDPDLKLSVGGEHIIVKPDGRLCRCLGCFGVHYTQVNIPALMYKLGAELMWRIAVVKTATSRGTSAENCEKRDG